MMMAALLRAVLRFRKLVWALVALAVALSVYAIRTAPLDAIPDISDPQVVVYVKWPRSAQLIESDVTEPLIRALIGSPGVNAIRGTSHMGYSFIYVILDTTADQKLYLADSTENAVVIIDARNNTFEKVMNVGLYPWGTHIMDSKDNYCH